MERVLVVDDSRDQARMIAGILQAAGYGTETTADGKEALAALEVGRPDIVVTDLRMPGLSGLELVEEVVRIHPNLPVVLMTAYGNGEIAMRALQKGAASYLPKRLIVEELVDTVEQVLELTRARKERERMLASVVESESRFVLTTDPSLISPLISFVEQLIEPQIRELGENMLMRLSLALQEALLNAVHHGNLEVHSEIREKSMQEYQRMISERCTLPPYCDRHIFLTVSLDEQEVMLTVEDQGPGFDIASVPDPTDPANLLRSSGRGLYLIGTFMDRVTHNAQGNRITMVKRVPDERAGTSAEGQAANRE